MEEGQELLRLFATCAGRLSALMEHQWLLSSPEAEGTEARRRAMIALVDAVRPAGSADRVLSLRIEAKAVQARLLRRAVFSFDTTEAARAQETSDRLIAQCEALLPVDRKGGS